MNHFSILPAHIKNDMVSCIQDATHHAEGDVFTHTQMVYGELHNLPEFKALDAYAQSVLAMSAVLHDIAKPYTVEHIDGHISHPRHAKIGANIARKLLDDAGYDMDFIRDVYFVVKWHGYPFFAINKELKKLIAISMDVKLQWLYIFSKADLFGRICNDADDILLNIQLFKEMAIENGCFDKPFTFANDTEKYHYFKFDDSYWNKGLPEYDSFAYMTVGISASGKDSNLKKLNLDLPVISLDAIRAELNVRHDDSKGAGHVFNLAKERMKGFLRKKESFVFNATNITSDMRSKFYRLCNEYGTPVIAIDITKNIGNIIKDNADRKGCIPNNAIMAQWNKYEFVSETEVLNTIRIKA